ncbi:MAG: hypothetical protein QMC90_04080, partial [Dehalococcoidales bacterium]|nr:hypothetical protein [Dehalococcoidales bacterium]
IVYVAPDLVGTAGTVTAPLTPGTKYYARVRVATSTAPTGLGAPVRSRWSETVEFTTPLAAPAPPVSLVPGPGAAGVILNPTFQWAPVAGAVSYKLELSTDPNFATILHSAEPTAAYYALPVKLDYYTPYYWRVRALGAAGVPISEWVASVFTTMAAPPPPPPPPVEIPPAPAPIAPAYIWAIILIGAILVIAVLVLIVRTRRVA